MNLPKPSRGEVWFLTWTPPKTVNRLVAVQPW